jgi:hypothetical protein
MSTYWMELIEGLFSLLICHWQQEYGVGTRDAVREHTCTDSGCCKAAGLHLAGHSFGLQHTWHTLRQRVLITAYNHLNLFLKCRPDTCDLAWFLADTGLPAVVSSLMHTCCWWAY